MKTKFTLFFLVLFLTTSCQKALDYTRTANEISNYLGVSVRVGFENKANTSDGASSVYTIDIPKIADVEKGTYPAELVASGSAHILYQRMSKEGEKESEKILVRIDGKDGGKEFTYTFGDFRRIERYKETSQKFAKALKSPDFGKIYDEFIYEPDFRKTEFDSLSTDKFFKQEAFTRIDSMTFDGFVRVDDKIEIVQHSRSGKIGLRIYTSFRTSVKTNKISGFYILPLEFPE